jgi:signal transduction histidine kinase
LHPDRDVRCAVERATGDFDVNWDNDRIAQVVANLVGNALAHGQDPVTIQMADKGDEISIEVSNRGEIPGDVLPRLFDPFVETPTTGRHGLGLGLYIVQQIAQAHGGTVQGESSNGMTTIKVTLPRGAQSRSNAS